ncbi:alpha/beta hydrolase [Halopseudomonas sp. SMJS2]|uniref:alpha/beta fold hydrolase n=1 Tax=Halopseudomonas sp. SMJS2 TaxID=3041098 RepID=UPI0024531123|nr:alpha/beta hydrolase [Halopseudomonas sp. SMJS2]WGK61080.1 alpha/beta hydrolase [Halopseudomonas sp. SMJS2]
MNQTSKVSNPAARSSVMLEHGRITYLGRGDGEPMVLLHGINGNASSWEPQLEAFSASGRVIAWDAPGYGGSDVVGDDLTDLARAAIAFIRRVSVVPVTLVGHSMGGLVAMKVAILAPSLVKRLVLSCTHPGHALSRQGEAGERYKRRLHELSNLPPEEYGQRRAKGMLPVGTAAAVFQRVAEIAAESRLEGVSAAAWAIQTVDLKPELVRIQAPTLVITCDQDTVAPLVKAQPLLESIPDVRHLELSGLGHAPYLEDPSRFNAALVEFLASA